MIRIWRNGNNNQFLAPPKNRSPKTYWKETHLHGLGEGAKPFPAEPWNARYEPGVEAYNALGAAFNKRIHTAWQPGDFRQPGKWGPITSEEIVKGLLTEKLH